MSGRRAWLALLAVMIVAGAFLAAGIVRRAARAPAPEMPPAPAAGQDAPAGGRGTSAGVPTEGGSGVGLELLVDGLHQPLYVTHAGDGSGRLFIAERGGRVLIWDGDRLVGRPFADFARLVGARGLEQGLLSLAFHPDYPANGLVFVGYTARDGSSTIARYRVDRDDPNRLDPDSAAVLLTVPQPYANHNGGLVAFGPDGYLYLGLGDGGSAGDPEGNGQNPETLLGALLRLDVDGADETAGEPGAAGYRVPPDNPFVGRPGRDEIWAIGLRNPWRFSFDRETGDLYIADVGQDAVEEVNFQPASSPGGQNYGWNVWEGSRRYRPGETAGPAIFPVAEYPNDGGGCSVTGGYVYRGRAVPALDGVYVFGDFCSGTIWGLRNVGGEWRMAELLRTRLQIASFGEDEAGELYVVDFAGAIYRVVPGDQPIPPALDAPDGPG